MFLHLFRDTRQLHYHVPIMKGNKYTGSIAILIPLEKLGKRFVENIRTGETGYGSMISEIGIELFNPIRKPCQENQSMRFIRKLLQF